jgi:predicted O-methyltransferase YrrM
MYTADSLPGIAAGTFVTIDKKVRIQPRQGAAMHSLISAAGAKSSLEIGMAYGFSTMWILDAISRRHGASHVSIDPYQKTVWGGVGLEAAHRLDCHAAFEWIEERSDFAVATFAKSNRQFDFIFIDGNHRFDDVICDFYLSDQVLAPQGIVAFDDLWMPSIQSAVSFIERNRSYDRIQTPEPNMVAFRKRSDDERGWQHFVPFDGDPTPPSLFQRLRNRVHRLFH